MKQQEHVNFASLVTQSDRALDLQQSRVIERASLNSSVWFWQMESALAVWSTCPWVPPSTPSSFGWTVWLGKLLRKNVNKAAESRWHGKCSVLQKNKIHFCSLFFSSVSGGSLLVMQCVSQALVFRAVGEIAVELDACCVFEGSWFSVCFCA